MVHQSKSSQQTKKIAAQIAQQFKNKGGIITLTGNLGAGKTTFVQGFAKTIGIKDKIISPTFVLIRQHQIPNSERMLYHLDLYRLEKTSETREIGLEELFEKTDDIILIEWPEKIADKLPKETTHINIKVISKNLRELITS